MMSNRKAAWPLLCIAAALALPATCFAEALSLQDAAKRIFSGATDELTFDGDLQLQQQFAHMTKQQSRLKVKLKTISLLPGGKGCRRLGVEITALDVMATEPKTGKKVPFKTGLEFNVCADGGVPNTK